MKNKLNRNLIDVDPDKKAEVFRNKLIDYMKSFN